MHKDISENPAKNAVTAPVDSTRKEADIDRKMRFYGIIQGFRQGKLPSNKQAEEALDYFVSTAPFDTSKLSREGQQLIEGFRKVVLDAKRMIQVKNADELIQEFIWNTKEISYQDHAENIKGVSAPTDKSTMQAEGQQAVEHLRTLGKLLFTNSEVRKLISDVGILARDVAADAAENLAETARPDEHDLRKADEPAPHAQWIGPDGQKHGPNDPVPDTGVGRAADKFQQKKEEVKADAQQQGQEQAQQSQRRAQNVDPNNQDQAQGVAQDEAQAAKGRAAGLFDKHVPDDYKEKYHPDKLKGTADRQVQKSKDYFKDKFPEERQDKFIYRLKKVVVEQQKHDDYNQAVEFFIDQFYNYKGHANHIAGQGTNKAGDIRSDANYAAAETSLRVLLERFANNSSMQPIFDAVDVLYTDAQNDDELRHWWNSLGSYVKRILLEEGYILQDQSTEDGKQIREKGRKFWDHKYKGHRQDLLDSIEEFAYAYNDDPLNKQLGVDIKQLLKDLVYDGDGKLTYKPHLISDLRHTIIPQVLGKAGYLPIPRLEYRDKQFEIVLENITAEIANIIPNLIDIQAFNHWTLSQFDNMGDKSEHSFRIGFSQIQADIRDVGFFVRKHSGFPKLTEQGLADVVISGKGVYGDIHLSTNDDRASVFSVKDVTIKIDNMAFKLRNTKHNLLYGFVAKTATSLIKNAIAKAIEKAIREALVQLDQQLTDIREAANEGARRDDSTRLQAVRERAQQKKEKADANKEKAKAKVNERQPEFKIVTTRDQEMINWESPNSYVGKEGNLAAHATKGDDTWRSPVFSVTHDGLTSGKVPHTLGNEHVAGSGNAASTGAHHTTTGAPRI